MKNKNVEIILQEDFVDEIGKVYIKNDMKNFEEKSYVLQSKYKDTFNEMCNLLEENLGNDANIIIDELEDLFNYSRKDIERFIENLEENRRIDSISKKILSKKMKDLCYELDEVSENKELDVSVDTVNKQINNANDIIDSSREEQNDEIRKKIQYKVEDAVMTELKAEIRRSLYRREVLNDEMDYNINRILDSKLHQAILNEFEESDRINEKNILSEKENLISDIKSECLLSIQNQMKEEKENEKKENEEPESDFIDELKNEVKSEEEIIKESNNKEDNEVEKDKEKGAFLDPNVII